jgi:hypothetical protein
MGVARLALVVLGVIALVALVVVGARALLASLDTAPPNPPAATSAPPATPARVATLRIECVADGCPSVLVRVPGGDVLRGGEMAEGEVVSFYEPELDVVIEDGGTVEVTENGTPRPPGRPGRKEEFTVRGPGE